MNNNITTNIEGGSFQVKTTSVAKRNLRGKVGEEQPTSIEATTEKLSLTIAPEKKVAKQKKAETPQKLDAESDGAAALTTYSSLPDNLKGQYRDTLMDLNKNARLFIFDKEGVLQRSSPAEVKNALDSGKEVILVTRTGEERGEEYSHGCASGKTEGFLNYYDYNVSEHTSSGSYRNVTYSTSKLNSWEDLDFVGDGKGVPGTSFLPRSGASVRVSETWERKWREESENIHGFFRIHHDYSHSGEHYKVDRKAEE